MHATLSRLDGINENITVLIFNSPPARGVLRFLSAVFEHSFDGSIWIRPTFPVLFMDFFLSVRKINDFPTSVVRLDVDNGTVGKDRILISRSVNLLDGTVRKPHFSRPVRVRYLSLSVVELQGFRAVSRCRVTSLCHGVEVNLIASDI